MSLQRRLEAKYSIDAQAMGVAEWICKNTTLKGKPFSFDRYPFQRQIADDMHPNMVCEKLSQIGLTEIQIRKALTIARRNSQTGVNVQFTLADDNLFDKVSSTRVKPIIENDPVFNLEEDQKAIRNKNTYQFGRSFLYLTGATESDATSNAVDFMFNDELDLTNQDTAALFSSRLQGSDYKVRQQFSTPTFTAYGVNSLMAISDYHEYMIRCEACNHTQIPVFERRFCNIPGLPSTVEDLMDIENAHLAMIDVGGAYVRCERCSRALDLGNSALREWVPMRPGAPMRGYKVRPFSTDRLDIEYIILQLIGYKKNNKIRRFKNTVLGEADDGGNARLSYEEIKACFGSARVPDIDKQDGVFVGIDMGQICTITLGKGHDETDVNVFKTYVCHIDKLIEEVKKICDRYNVVAGTVDRHPYEPDAERVFTASGGKIWPAEYRGTKEIAPVKNAEQKVIHWQIDRTEHLDRVCNRIKAGKFLIEGYQEETTQDLIVQQLRNMVRIEEPETPAKWQKLDENDHFFHSAAFMLTATKLPSLISYFNKESVRVTVEMVAISAGAALPTLPGFVHHDQNKSLRSRHTKVYQ